MKSKHTILKQVLPTPRALAATGLRITSQALSLASHTAGVAARVIGTNSKKAARSAAHAFTNGAKIATSTFTKGTKGAVNTFSKGTDLAKAKISHVKIPPKTRPYIIGSAIVLASGAAIAGTVLAVKKIRERHILSFPSKFGTARIYEVKDDAGHPVRLLEVDGIVQSGTYVADGYEDASTPPYTQLVFDYLKKYDTVFARKADIKRVCVLGCGGYDYPKHLIADHAPVAVDAVEIDPTITSLAERYFYLDRLIEEHETESTGRLNLIENDALVQLLESETTYDAIINDTFDGGTVPEHLSALPFYMQVKRRLNEGGIYATNIVGALKGPNSSFLQQQMELMRAVFEHVEVIPCDNDDPYSEDNVVILAY